MKSTCFSLIFLLFFFDSCNTYKKIAEKKVIQKIKVNTQSSSECYFFFNEKLDTLKFNRTIKIVKNTLTDTVILGHALLPPKYVGKMEYTKLADRDDTTLDLTYDNPPANRIWINPYNGKKSLGGLVFELEELKN